MDNKLEIKQLEEKRESKNENESNNIDKDRLKNILLKKTINNKDNKYKDKLKEWVNSKKKMKDLKYMKSKKRH